MKHNRIGEKITALRATLPQGVTLIAVSKYHPAEAVQAAYDAGQRDFGESKAQDLTAKHATLPKDINWHFIGHLQTNKVRQVVGKVSLIHSIDSLRLLKAVSQEAAKQGIVQDVLLEVNVAMEESKSGFEVAQVLPLLEHIGEYPNIFVRGLMAIPPISKKIGDNRKFFQEILQLSVDISEKKYDNVAVECLSMGMSDDFEDAICCGSTMIRIGTAIFGARDYTKLHQK